MPDNEKVIYLTFDDGPHPTITPFVLEELKKYNALATFFCIGKNVVQYPEIYQRIINERHATGNHTHNHLNGWKTPTALYLNNVAEAAKHIDSNLFRPPYGKIKSSQAKEMAQAMNMNTAKIIMWDVLSADFDQSVSPQQCLDNILKNASKGSIVVFHDSEKAFSNMKYALPKALKHLQNEGYGFKKIAL